jgi:hypothetical protein
MEIGMTMVRLKRSIMLGALALSLSSATLLAQGSHGAPNATEYRPDYPSMRREIQNFEVVANQTILSAFKGEASVLTGKAKGAYLSGYGVTFSFTVNIYRGALVWTPFGLVKTSEDLTPEQKQRSIEDVKEKLSRVLLENGESLRQIRVEDWITITGFFDDRNFPGEPNQSKTVILSVLKKDLDEASRAEDRWKELKMRMKTVEY